jgi:hypothetical protein
MIETDYIMRMIGLLTTLLARLFFLKRAKEFPQVLMEIDNAEKSLLGVDRNLIRSLSPSQIMELFGSDQSLAIPKRYVLGVLMKEEADILSLRGEGLVACYETLGRFDKAENALFELMALDLRFYETGLLFYQRLLARNDKELIQGKLPRPEVEEGEREFKRRFCIVAS